MTERRLEDFLARREGKWKVLQYFPFLEGHFDFNILDLLYIDFVERRNIKTTIYKILKGAEGYHINIYEAPVKRDWDILFHYSDDVSSYFESLLFLTVLAIWDFKEGQRGLLLVDEFLAFRATSLFDSARIHFMEIKKDFYECSD